MPERQMKVSAQVMLRAASGKAVRGDTAITSANISEYVPAPEAAERVRQVFAGLGFEVGNLVGNSLSITAPASVFERVFQVEIQDQEGGRQFVTRAGTAGAELPREAVPAEIAAHVAAITFSRPPDFGPKNFM